MTTKREPVACKLPGEEQVERRRRWEELCRRSLLELTSTADGVELRFDKDPSAEAELRSLVVLERDCCSFARWVLREDDGQLALQVGAAPDAVAAVQALFMAGRSAPSAERDFQDLTGRRSASVMGSCSSRTPQRRPRALCAVVRMVKTTRTPYS